MLPAQLQIHLESFFSLLLSGLLRLITLSCIDVVTNSIASETNSFFRSCFRSLLTQATTPGLQKIKVWQVKWNPQEPHSIYNNELLYLKQLISG